MLSVVFAAVGSMIKTLGLYYDDFQIILIFVLISSQVNHNSHMHLLFFLVATAVATLVISSSELKKVKNNMTLRKWAQLLG